MPAEIEAAVDQMLFLSKVEQVIDRFQERYGLEWQALAQDSSWFISGGCSLHVCLVPPKHENFAEETAFLWVVVADDGRYKCAHGTQKEAEKQSTTISAVEMLTWLRTSMDEYLPDELKQEVFVGK